MSNRIKSFIQSIPSPKKNSKIPILIISTLLLLNGIFLHTILKQYTEMSDLKSIIQDKDEAYNLLKKVKNENVRGVKENTVEEEDDWDYVPIEGYSDCPKEYEPSSNDYIHEVDNNTFITQNHWGQDPVVGWCLYHVKNDKFILLDGGPNHRGISVIAFIQNRYVLYGQGCGTECYYITMLDTEDPHLSKILGWGPYFELSDDHKWIFCYRRALYQTPNDENEVALSLAELDNQHMVTAINLETFDSFTFAENIYVKGGIIYDIKLYNDYFVDVFAEENSKGLNFYDESTGLISIPFKDMDTEEVEVRVFDSKNNFEEITTHE